MLILIAPRNRFVAAVEMRWGGEPVLEALSIWPQEFNYRQQH